jgi:hypothetical protein
VAVSQNVMRKFVVYLKNNEEQAHNKRQISLSRSDNCYRLEPFCIEILSVMTSGLGHVIEILVLKQGVCEHTLINL